MNKSLVEIQAGYDEPEDDLTWLARNVHEWPSTAMAMCCPSYFDDPIRRRVDFREDSAWIQTANVTITKQEWLARRAELQNKPPVSSWPDWVKWVAQWSDGQWLGYEVKPECGNEDDPDDCYVDPRKSHAFTLLNMAKSSETGATP